jgi:hypothetical protein
MPPLPYTEVLLLLLLHFLIKDSSSGASPSSARPHLVCPICPCLKPRALPHSFLAFANDLAGVAAAAAAAAVMCRG